MTVTMRDETVSVSPSSKGKDEARSRSDLDYTVPDALEPVYSIDGSHG